MIDLGCRPGQIGAFLAAQGVNVLSLDLSLEMLREASDLLPGTGQIEADMRALPFADSSVGGIVAFYSLIHIPPNELPATISELGRVLKTDGYLALTTHVTPPTSRGTLRDDGDNVALHVDEMLSLAVDLAFYFYGIQQLLPCLERAGLELLNCTERDPYEPELETQTRRMYLLARKQRQGT